MLIPALGFGQLDLMKQLKGVRARSVGPAGMSGRVTALASEPGGHKVLYAGTASGGLWKSRNSGLSWRPIFDKQPTLSIGAVAVGKANPDLVWAGTGEGNPRNSQTSGAGIYRSLDAGRTWQFMGLKETKTIHRIHIDPRDENIVYVAAVGSAWGKNPERGVYKTMDGGKTWKKILYVNEGVGCADLVMDPRNPSKLIASMWEYERKPWTFNSGGPGSGIYITVDGGENWTRLDEKSGIPKGNLGRVGLAIAPSNTRTVYALIESKKLALYKSMDGGYKWKKVGEKNVGNRPFYYADIRVAPNDENWIYSLWSRVTYSKDGGKTFNFLFNYNKVHPDFQSMYIDPHDPDFMIVGNDGGMSISEDRGRSWRGVRDLPVGQFYHINHDFEYPYNIYGGMQDNGSWVGPSTAMRHGGIQNSDWEELLFGDGFDVVPDPNDSRFGWGMYQGGNVYRYDRKTGRTNFVQPVHAEGIELRYNWNAAIAADPHNKNGLYFGSQFVHYSSDKGMSWKTISPDLSTNDKEKQQQAKSGGLTIDATRAENFTAILAIEPSPVEKDVIWVGTDDGNVQLTRDGGKTWSNLSGVMKGMPRGAWVPQIYASRNNKGEAFVVVNDYRRNNWKPYVFHTRDYGKTWKNIAASFKDTYCLSACQVDGYSKLIFIGTENGLMFSTDYGATWNKFTNGLPSVSVMDIKYQTREGDLVLGTFGRGAYVIDKIRPLMEMSAGTFNPSENKFQVLKNEHFTTGYNYAFKPNRDTHFKGDGIFRGRTDGTGASVDVFVPLSEDTTKKKKKLHAYILAGSDTIRHFTVKVDTGLHRVTWNMRRDGIRFPSHKEPKEKKILPPGRIVQPGSYEMIVSYQKESGKATVHVKGDPRVPEQEPSEGYMERIKRYDRMVRTTSACFKRLKTMKKRVALINQAIPKAKKDSVYAKLQKAGKAVVDSIKKIEGLVLEPKDFVGYDHVTVRISSKLWNASEYINDPSFQSSSGNAALAIELAEREVVKLMEMVNKFQTTEWQKYLDHVSKANLKLTKTYKNIKLK